MPTGERGEVWIKGPQVMKGYLNRPQETADSLRDGWFRTGDVGYMDEDGHFFLVDRLKDLILCSGYNVYPQNGRRSYLPASRRCRGNRHRYR